MEPPSSEADPTSETYHRGSIWVSAVGACAALALAAWTIVRWKPSRVKIEGASMAPTLVEGDWCLVVKERSWRRGDVVVVEHPDRPGYEMVKRVVAGPGDVIGERRLVADEFWVEGDHPSASTDSRTFGPVRIGSIKGRVVVVYGPAERRRVLARG